MAVFSLCNYFKILVQQEVCDWTGKREVEVRVGERERERERERKEPKRGKGSEMNNARYDSEPAWF